MGFVNGDFRPNHIAPRSKIFRLFNGPEGVGFGGIEP